MRAEYPVPRSQPSRAAKSPAVLYSDLKAIKRRRGYNEKTKYNKKIWLFLKQKIVLMALLYLLNIFGFAFCYHEFFGNSFFHSTFKYEKEVFEREEKLILLGIKESIIKNYLNNNEITEKFGYFKIGIEDLILDNLKYQDNKFSFTLEVSIETATDKKEDIPVAKVSLFDSDYRLLLFMKNLNKNILNNFKYIEINSIDPINENLLLNPNGFFPQDKYRDKFRKDITPIIKMKIEKINHPLFGVKDLEVPQLLEISSELNKKLGNYINGLNGFPKGLVDSFWRMLYFSATTVTTLGYGDIVPITNATRTLVTIQAILGMIIIGLFLYFLTERINKNNLIKKE